MQQGIKNIIFDLGGIIIHIDKMKAVTSFRAIMGDDFDLKYEQLRQEGFFKKYETGGISGKEFLQSMAIITGATRKAITDCWNATLLEIPAQKLYVLRALKKDYRLFLLSNTNPIHMSWIFNHLKERHKMDGFAGVFEKTYLSYELALRKPDVEIFRWVLQKSRLNATETLFVDDDARNISSAKKLGIVTRLMLRNEDWAGRW